jgi:hypothetical protein
MKSNGAKIVIDSIDMLIALFNNFNISLPQEEELPIISGGEGMIPKFLNIFTHK